MQKQQIKKLVIFSVVAVVAGVGLGFAGSRVFGDSARRLNATDSQIAQEVIAQVATDATTIQNGDVFGSANEDIFVDSAQGFLAEGGINGEGSHHLLRPGGNSQTVYIASSVTDLDSFIGMEVRVWGETHRGQAAGWFMDVGRVQVVNIRGEAPTE
ncbi:MAG: hypothetical protein LBG64_01955 [Pseudomonadales bacterium]|jgi:hypothetical protein|nr:hypothetical protein [Pseudomonadales bacterium]